MWPPGRNPTGDDVVLKAAFMALPSHLGCSVLAYIRVCTRACVDIIRGHARTFGRSIPDLSKSKEGEVSVEL